MNYIWCKTFISMVMKTNTKHKCHWCQKSIYIKLEKDHLCLSHQWRHVILKTLYQKMYTKFSYFLIKTCDVVNHTYIENLADFPLRYGQCNLVVGHCLNMLYFLYFYFLYFSLGLDGRTPQWEQQMPAQFL